jgi:hypothetical protein
MIGSGTRRVVNMNHPHRSNAHRSEPRHSTAPYRHPRRSAASRPSPQAKAAPMLAVASRPLCNPSLSVPCKSLVVPTLPVCTSPHRRRKPSRSVANFPVASSAEPIRPVSLRTHAAHRHPCLSVPHRAIPRRRDACYPGALLRTPIRSTPHHRRKPLRCFPPQCAPLQCVACRPAPDRRRLPRRSPRRCSAFSSIPQRAAPSTTLAACCVPLRAPPSHPTGESRRPASYPAPRPCGPLFATPSWPTACHRTPSSSPPLRTTGESRARPLQAAAPLSWPSRAKPHHRRKPIFSAPLRCHPSQCCLSRIAACSHSARRRSLSHRDAHQATPQAKAALLHRVACRARQLHTMPCHRDLFHTIALRPLSLHTTHTSLNRKP